MIIRFLDSVWYQKNPAGLLLAPLGWVYLIISNIRRYCYQKQLFKVSKLPIPVIIIGNISVGGTGKTPLIIWMANFLKTNGIKPGIVSRGYGGQSVKWPVIVNRDTDAHLVGDEAVVISRQTVCPMAVGPDRAAAGKMLMQHFDCDVILSDDGMQHYALARDIEIAVVDGERRFGNERCLPAGPLREPVSRLQSVDMIIFNGTDNPGEYSMAMEGEVAVHIKHSDSRPLSKFKSANCHALAGIGNPARFFNFLQSKKINFDIRIFPDHHHFQSSDIYYNDDYPVLMTEKDAVKCMRFAGEQHWFVPVTAKPDNKFSEHLLKLVKEKING